MIGSLVFAHRWVGVVLALFMLIWFSSGSLIAFVGVPTLTHAQRLAHGESLAPQGDWLPLGEALEISAAERARADAKQLRSSVGDDRSARAGKNQIALDFVEARLTRIDRIPAWIVEDGRGQRFAISATDGALLPITAERAQRIAGDWRVAESKLVSSLNYLDTVDTLVGLRNPEASKPFHRFAIDDGLGSQLVVSARTGEVVQQLTASERALAYAGNWLHLFRWLDALGAADYRRDALTWTGLFAAAGALTGLILGWIRWRPGFFGRPTYLGGRQQPYREFWLKYHFWVGLLGGTFALLWAASGFLSTNPGQIFSAGAASREELSRYRGDRPPAVIGERSAIASLALGSDVVELQWTRLGDEARLFAWTRAGARRQLLPENTSGSYSEQSLLAAARRIAGDKRIAGSELLEDYDSYYYASRRQGAEDKPLPALRVDLADPQRTSLYLDPVEGRLLAKFDESSRWRRWLYSAVHHWDFGWFRNAWLWNGWMASWISLGVALGASAVVLGWRRLRLTLEPLASRPRAASASTRQASPQEKSA